MTALSKALTHLRGKRNQSQLARDANVSRAYYSLLESGGGEGAGTKRKDPSLEFLRKVARTLIGDELETNKQVRDACRLGLAALDYPFNDPFEDMVGSIDNEIEVQSKSSVEEIWIIADVIAENVHAKLLEQTVKNLMRDPPVRYVYFVPRGGQWDTFLKLVELSLKRMRVKDPHFLHKENRLRAVACPSMLCVVPIRVLNPSSSPKVTITLGETLDHLLLFSLAPAQVKTVVTELTGILSGLGLQREWTSDHVTYELLYPLEGGKASG